MASREKLRGSGAPAWMSQLGLALGRYQVPAREVSCDGGLLRVVMGHPDEEMLEAEVRPMAEGAQGWAVVEGFVLGYQGQDDLGPHRERWMKALAAVVKGLAHVMPPALDTGGALFTGRVNPEQRFRRSFPFCDVERSQVRGQEVVEVLLRATSRCNQACPFCSASERASASASAVGACIRAAGKVYPGCLLSITGGEPTLRPTFLDEVALALEQPGVGQVQVQTNAVAFARRLDPAALASRDDLSFFTSLHALDPAIYDACTATQGQLPRALQGITRLMEAGHRVTVNCLVQGLNLDHLPGYIEALPAALPWNARAALHFSVLICPEYRPGAQAFLVPYARLAPALEAAAARASALGLRVDPLRSSTHAAIPACLLGAREREHDPHRPRVQAGETGHDDLSLPWVKAARCQGCLEDPYCLGLPAPYARRFGLDEPEPLT